MTSSSQEENMFSFIGCVTKHLEAITAHPSSVDAGHLRFTGVFWHSSCFQMMERFSFTLLLLLPALCLPHADGTSFFNFV
jgi:hypothetical protein